MNPWKEEGRGRREGRKEGGGEGGREGGGEGGREGGGEGGKQCMKAKLHKEVALF